MLHRRATSRSSRRYFEALLFSEIIKRTELDEDHSTEHRWGIFYHKYGPEIRRAAISLERIGKKKKEKKSANEREGRVSFFLSEAIGGKIEEKIIAKDSDWRFLFFFLLYSFDDSFQRTFTIEVRFLFVPYVDGLQENGRNSPSKYSNHSNIPH